MPMKRSAQVVKEISVSQGEWYVYLLRCADDTLYTGIATNLERRLAQHNGEIQGGPRYTQGRRPVELLWSASAADRSAATRREFAIKRLSKAQKLALAGR